MRSDHRELGGISGVVVDMNISDKAIRAAMLDTVLQQDKRREQILIEALREKQCEITRIQREMKRLCADLLIIQRQQASLVDAISLELAG